MMNIRIDPIDITCRLLGSVWLAFEDVDLMLAASFVPSMESQSKFQWHIESRNSLRGFSTGEVMDGIVGRIDQIDNGVEAVLIGNRECKDRPQPQLNEANDVAQEQILKL